MVWLCSGRQQVRNESSVLGKLANAIVSAVGNNNSVGVVNGHTFRPQQTSVVIPSASKIGNQFASGWVKQLELVISRICDDDTVVGVDGYKVGHTQLGILCAIRSKLSDTFTTSTVDTNLLADKHAHTHNGVRKVTI